jgi:hypothetical protein
MQKGPSSRNEKRACVLQMQKELVFSKCKRSSTAELAIEVPVGGALRSVTHHREWEKMFSKMQIHKRTGKFKTAGGVVISVLSYHHGWTKALENRLVAACLLSNKSDTGEARPKANSVEGTKEWREGRAHHRTRGREHQHERRARGRSSVFQRRRPQRGRMYRFQKSKTMNNAVAFFRKFSIEEIRDGKQRATTANTQSGFS